MIYIIHDYKFEHYENIFLNNYEISFIFRVSCIVIVSFKKLKLFVCRDCLQAFYIETFRKTFNFSFPRT